MHLYTRINTETLLDYNEKLIDLLYGCGLGDWKQVGVFTLYLMYPLNFEPCKVPSSKINTTINIKKILQ